MAHGRGKKPPTRKGPRVPNNKKSMKYGHHLPDGTPSEHRSAPSHNNHPRAHRKISKGFIAAPETAPEAAR
jgi:hypothetical protein